MTEAKEVTPWWPNVTAALAQMRVLFTVFKAAGDAPGEEGPYGWLLRFKNPRGFEVVMLAEENWLHMRTTPGAAVDLSAADLFGIQDQVLHARLVRDDEGRVQAQVDLFHDLVNAQSITVALGALAQMHETLERRAAATPPA